MDKDKKQDSIWKSDDKPHILHKCSSGITFWPDKKKEQGEKK